MNEFERAQLLLDSWKQAVDVQMHFNDIEIRIRNMAITVVGALLGAGAFGGATDKVLNPVLLGSVAFVAWLAFYFMDRLWYHRLLMGAVKQGADIEKALRDLLPEVDLTSAISKTSPVKIGSWEMHSKQKMDIFYGGIAVGIVVATIIVALGGTASESDADELVVGTDASVTEHSDESAITREAELYDASPSEMAEDSSTSSLPDNAPTEMISAPETLPTIDTTDTVDSDEPAKSALPEGDKKG